MGRMHSNGKGISRRTVPYKRTPPSWLQATSVEVEENVCSLARKGYTPSQIGVQLRDSHGIGLVKNVTGKKILRILKSNGLNGDLPEDLYHLIKKAVSVRKHLARHHKDKVGKYQLILTEAKIHRLTRYYKRKKVLASNFKYDSNTAATLVQ